jgi:hypothetical protein
MKLSLSTFFKSKYFQQGILMEKNANNNVLCFPKPNIRMVPPQNPGAASSAIIDFQDNYINEALGMVIPVLFEHLMILGFSSDEDGDDHRGNFVVEALRSFMMQKYDAVHPFQKMADNLFIQDECGAPGDLVMRRDLNIFFRQKKKSKEKAKTSVLKKEK